MLESRTGKVFIIIYALFTLGMYGWSFACGTATCGLYIVVPIMPWAFILAQDLGISFPWAMYPIFILMNASVLYVLGAGLEWLYHRYQEKRVEAAEATHTHSHEPIQTNS